MTTKLYRHGDVELIKVGEIPQDVKKLERKELACGELTGHAHRIDFGDLFETKDGSLYLKVKGETQVSHEEHKTKVVPPGIYRVNIKRQYLPTGWERVLD